MTHTVLPVSTSVSLVSVNVPLTALAPHQGSSPTGDDELVDVMAPLLHY
jgi:hypothetical protein